MHPSKPTTLVRRVGTYFAAFVALASAAFAQSTTGSLEGRVLNVTNGSYLNNARVTVEGTALQTFTDAGGRYRLDGVPSGTVSVHAFYTGLPEQTHSISVPAGQTVTQDFDLGAAADAKVGDVVKLDEFKVASRREMDATSIAINEQRFAGTIKNVVNTDAFGDIAEGNVGDFVKFLPGVTIDYVSPDARTISVRGVAANYTSLMLNGNPVASASSSSESRTVELEQISLNNSARIEITKSRSPEQPASALGGAVNLVARTAFEYSKPSISYRAFVSANGDEKEWKMTRGPASQPSRKIKPGFDLLWINPVNKNFGFTLSILESNIYYPQHRTQMNWGPGQGAQAGSSPEHPVLRSYQVQDGPKNNQRESVGFTADWRITPRDVISMGFQWSFYNAFFGNRPVTYTLGNTAPPVNGASFDLVNGTFFRGASANGTTTLLINNTGSVSLGGTSFRHKYGYTYQPDLNWRHTGPVWRLDAGLSFSHATNHYHDYQDDHFAGVTVGLHGNPTNYAPGNATVVFDEIDKGSYLYPRIKVLNNTGTAEINLADPNNYTIVNGTMSPADSVDQFKTVRGSARRDFQVVIPFSVKVGFQIQEQIRDIRLDNPGAFGFVGPDRTSNTADDNMGLYDLIDPQYGYSPFLFNTPQVPFPSPYKLWTLYKFHPEYFSVPTEATFIQNISTASKYFRETISAGYIQGDTRLINNRLRIVTGIRFERTDDYAAGPTNNPNASKGITDPTAAARARYGIRQNKVKKHYGAGYPSLDVAFNVTQDLVARAAYSRSIGRPDLSNILPGVTLPDLSASSATITINNPSLAPTQTNSYDVSLEYYFSKNGAGIVSIGAFEKDFANFVGSPPGFVPTVQELIDLGVPDAALYLGAIPTLQVRTKLNTGDAKLTGVEFNFKQVLNYDFLPAWAKNKFTIFANGQKMHLEGSTLADFSNFIRESGSWGASYGSRFITVQANFNYRGRQRLTAQNFAPGGYDYFKPRVYLDANIEIRYKPWMNFFVNARNLTNVAQDIQRYAPVVTPSWSRTYRREEFGVQYTVGIKGKF